MKITLQISQHQLNRNQNDKIGKIDQAEQPDVFAYLTISEITVRIQRYQACERSYRRTQPSYVHRDQQITVVGSEVREQHRRRNIADNLTGERSDQQRRFPHYCGQKALYHGYPRHVAREHKERAKR